MVVAAAAAADCREAEQCNFQIGNVLLRGEGEAAGGEGLGAGPGDAVRRCDPPVMKQISILLLAYVGGGKGPAMAACASYTSTAQRSGPSSRRTVLPW